MLRAAIILVIMVGPQIAQYPDFQRAERQIVRLPPGAFKLLPMGIVRELQRRGCTIPQETFSKMPNNVVSGQFARRGQKDWAVLCSVNGVSSVLVFWNGSTSSPADLGRSEDKNYLQDFAGDKIEFSRGITAVGKDFIMRHYRGNGGPKPPPIDHQGIDDAFLGKASVVQYFYDGQWRQLTGSD